MSDCPQFGAVFGGCRFEPRYDKAALDLTKVGKVEGGPAHIEAICARTYVHDVCVRCGRVVKRDHPEGT